MNMCNIEPLVKVFNNSIEISHHNSHFYHGSPFYTVVFKMYLYIHPGLCIAGVLENITSVVVFCSKSLRRVSSNVYLAALSAASCLFCFGNFLVWLETLNVGFIHQDIVCQAIIYTTYICSFLTVWFVVCITFENFLITVNIRCAVDVCTVTKARAMVVILTVFAFGLYSFSLWTTHVTTIGGKEHCTHETELEHVIHIFTFIDIIFTSILPCMTMVVFLAAINVKIIMKRISREPTDTHQAPRRARRNSKRTYQMLTRITKVLLAIGLTFTVFSFPTSINKMRILFSDQRRLRNPYVEWAINQLCLLVYYCSFCAYFFIYIKFSANYKKVLVSKMHFIVKSI